MFTKLAVRDFRNDLKYHFANPGLMRGVPTGFNNIDVIMGGMEPGLHTLAGATSSGKTAVALHYALNAAGRLRDPKRPELGTFVVWYATQEMRAQRCLFRLSASLSGVSTKAIQFGFRWENNRKVPLEKDDYTRFREAGEHVLGLPLYFREYAVSAEHLIHDINQTPEDERPHILFVDYLTYMLPPNGTQKDYDAINENLRLLKDGLAERFNVPVVLVAQLNRNVDSRENKRPTLADLEGSGRIGQRSRTVTLLYSADYYARLEDPEGFLPTHKLEVNIAKNQDGETGVAYLFYNQSTQHLEDWHEAGTALANPATGELPGPDLSGDAGIGSDCTIHPDGSMEPEFTDQLEF